MVAIVAVLAVAALLALWLSGNYLGRLAAFVAFTLAAWVVVVVAPIFADVMAPMYLLTAIAAWFAAGIPALFRRRSKAVQPLDSLDIRIERAL